MKQVRILINDLIDQHEDYSNCPGCEKCDKIAELRKCIDRDPAEKFAHLLAKGKDMTKSDIKLMLQHGVQRKDIFKALHVSIKTFYDMLKSFGLNEDATEVKLTLEEYEHLKGEGLKDKEIALEMGLSVGYVSQLKQIWGIRKKNKKARDGRGIRKANGRVKRKAQ